MSGTVATRWISFHLHGLGAPDAFLIDPFRSWVQGEAAAGHIRRFFFIRYSQGGDHLRLRFIPGPGADADDLATALQACIARHPAAVSGDRSPRLERHPYVRAELYFGETRASVYAELMNEATSWLALSLLTALGPTAGGARWVATAAALLTLLRRATDGDAGLAAALTASREFARESALAVGFATEPTAARARELGGAVAAGASRVASALATDAGAARTAALLRRALRGGDDERFAATHGLHLLCNKLGLSLRQEHEALVAAQASLAWDGAAPRASTGAAAAGAA